ncbi:MAG: hypothetical protein LBT18_04940 [Endomicrobium sp.]|jgi:lipopolysaccharide assembly outer membrane protein LptD (OstA)|nr:hypothetical protein [Endomicrobium sp.]
MIFTFVEISFANAISGKTIVTGNKLEVRNGGNVIISKGNSKAIDDVNVITADKMTYNKKSSNLSASSNVKLLSKTQDNEPLEAYGEFAQYCINDEKGKIWGYNTVVKYFMQTSTLPLILNAQEIYVDRKQTALSAYSNVEVITSSGTIYSDNAVFDKKTLSVVFRKDKKRPIADVLYESRKGLYEADEIVFYNSDDNKKIVMNGSVKGKIEMEDKK